MTKAPHPDSEEALEEAARLMFEQLGWDYCELLS